VKAGTATNPHYQLGRYFLTYLLVSKGNSANHFLDNVVDEDREKCRELLAKEFCAL
jgi:hypothetical protein